MVSLLSLYQPRKPLYKKVAVIISIIVIVLIIFINTFYTVYYFSAPKFDYKCMDTNYNDLDKNFLTGYCDTKELYNINKKPIYVNASYYSNSDYVLNSTSDSPSFNYSYTLDIKFQSVPIYQKMCDISKLQKTNLYFEIYILSTNPRGKISRKILTQLYRINKEIGIEYECKFNLCVASNTATFVTKKVDDLNTYYFQTYNYSYTLLNNLTKENKEVYNFPLSFIDSNVYNNITINCCGSVERSGINHIPIILSGIGGILSSILLFGNQLYTIVEKIKQYFDDKYYGLNYADNDTLHELQLSLVSTSDK